MKINTIDTQKAKQYYNLFLSIGVPKRKLDKSLDFSPEILEMVNKRIPMDHHFQLLSAGFALAEPGAALKIAHYIEGGLSGLLYHLISHCRNLEEAISLLVRYSKIYFTMVSWGIDRTKQTLMLKCFVNNPDYYRRYFIEMMLSAFIINTRKLTGVNYRPIEVRFKYDQPEYVQVYKEVFQTPLKFKAKEDALVIAQSDLNLKNPGHRLYIYDLLRGHAEKLLVDIESGELFTDKVQRIILERLPIEPADIQLVCNKLNLSRWTLNRKLRQEGTVFKNLCLETKKNLAMNYLKNQKLSVSEIAYLLGYTEAGSFTRAFKEWTGQSPKSYRLGVDRAGVTLLQDCQKE